VRLLRGRRWCHVRLLFRGERRALELQPFLSPRFCEVAMADYAIDHNDVIRMEIWCRCRGQYSLNVRNYKFTSSDASSLPLSHILNEANNNFAVVYPSNMATDAFYYGCRASRIHPNVGPSHDSPFLEQGIRPTFTSPQHLAAVIHCNVGLVGRRNRGRTYVPFIPMDRLQSDGTLTAAYLVTLDGLAQKVIMGFSWSSGPTSAHTLTGVERNPLLGVYRPFTNYIVRDSVASMRTRQQSRGNDTAPF